MYVPLHTMLGDMVVLLKGGHCPFVLRSAGSGKYTFIGPVYLNYTSRILYAPFGRSQYSDRIIIDWATVKTEAFILI